MRASLGKRVALVLAAWVVGSVSARADVKLPSLFADSMVLQRDMPVPVWGWADAGEKVTVTIGSQCKTATAGTDGKWSLKLDSLKAGGPLTLKVQGKNAIECKDVLVGEVWLCSGQSNMAMTVNRAMNFDAESAAAKHPKLRMFTVPRKTAETPQDKCEGSWKACTPENVGSFSATAYFFGRTLLEKLDVPVGLVHSSVGGTPIQSWTCQKAQAAVPELKPLVEGLTNDIAKYDPEAAKARFEKQLDAWKAAAAKAKAEKKEFKQRRPKDPQHPRVATHSPGRLYNGMIAPLAPYAIRGAIWYQGEANSGKPEIYGTQLRTMIGNWRKIWNEGDFPFLFVQLPNFRAPQTEPSEGGWALIREQFTKTLEYPNTGMAITLGLGETNDIHPKNKQEVGRRLAQWALAKTYGFDLVPGGPRYQSCRCEGNRMMIDFCDVGEGLTAAGGGKLKGFAIAGADKKFVWADARIEGQQVIVSSPQVPAPAAVRYAWANNPDGNLANKSGLSASTFRTDDWQE